MSFLTNEITIMIVLYEEDINLVLRCLENVKNHSQFVVSMSNEMSNNCSSIRNFLFENV